MTALQILAGKRIVLGVSGSIAAYKTADLASKLTQAGVQVDVILTEAAQKFITPLTFQALTGRPVYTDMWSADSNGGLPTHIAHVGLGEEADLLLIVPATANTLAKIAHGLADDLLSLTALTARCPIVVAPAMDAGMYTQPVTQANIERLHQLGIAVIEPEEGRFASGLTGKGRLPETSTLIGYIRQQLGTAGILAGQHVVITAGGTREPIDPVRFITNRSSGKQGYALAQAAIDVGATVTLISSIDTFPTPIGADLVTVQSAEEMQKAVLAHIQNASILIMAAAVADFRPATIATQKIKKSTTDDEPIQLTLVRNPDILLSVKQWRDESKHPLFVVGFAAESHDLIENATGKLQRKGLDIIVANNILAEQAGFQSDTNIVTLLFADGTREDLPTMLKSEVSDYLLNVVASRIPRRDKA